MDSRRPPPNGARPKAWDRYLRSLVRGLRGCLSSLAPGAQRLLVLRTGIEGGRPYSERQVARRMRVSLRRERRLERQAAASLTETAATGGCDAPALPSSAVSLPTTLLAVVNQAVAPITAPGGATRTVRAAAAPAGKHTPTSHRTASPSVRIVNSGLPAVPHGGSSPLIWILLAFAAAAVMLTSLTREIRSRTLLAPAAGMGAQDTGVGAQPEARAQALPLEVVAAAASAAATRPSAAAPRTEAPAITEDSNLGVALEHGGDVEGAIAAYRRAAAAGDANGAFNLGGLLAQRGDLDGALAAYGRADELGDAGGAAALGILLEQRGDLRAAQAALRRADERGDAAGACHLGAFMERHGDVEAAMAAYQRADDRGHATGAFKVGALLAQRGDWVRAKAALHRAYTRGDAQLAARARAAMIRIRSMTSR